MVICFLGQTNLLLVRLLRLAFCAVGCSYFANSIYFAVLSGPFSCWVLLGSSCGLFLGWSKKEGTGSDDLNDQNLPSFWFPHGEVTQILRTRSDPESLRYRRVCFFVFFGRAVAWSASPVRFFVQFRCLFCFSPERKKRSNRHIASGVSCGLGEECRQRSFHFHSSQG